MFRHSRRIYYADTDAGGVVYHARYLTFFDEARAEWLRSTGIAQSQIWNDFGIALAVRFVKVDFRRPARLDDLLVLHLELGRVGKASMELRQQAWRSDLLIAEAGTRIACLDVVSGKAVALPSAIWSAAQSPLAQ